MTYPRRSWTKPAAVTSRCPTGRFRTWSRARPGRLHRRSTGTGRHNEERFSLAGAAHWPLRGGAAVAGRAGERKTYWANPPAPQPRRAPRDADAGAVELVHGAMVVNVGQWHPAERWNTRRGGYNQCGYGVDLANMGFVCLRSAAESKALQTTLRICGNSRLREPINQGCRQRLTQDPIPRMLAPRSSTVPRFASRGHRCRCGTAPAKRVSPICLMASSNRERKSIAAVSAGRRKIMPRQDCADASHGDRLPANEYCRTAPRWRNGARLKSVGRHRRPPPGRTFDPR